MKMTLGRAKAILSIIWVFFGFIIFGLVAYLTVIEKFTFSKSSWDAGLSWAIPLILPVLAFIIPTWTVRRTKKDQIVLHHTHVLVAAVFLSACYFLGLFIVLWRLPEEIGDIKNYVEDVMRSSTWYLSFAQALVIVVLGKFFLEHIDEDKE
jgi:uncharacterized membrane protein YqjE